MKKTKHVTNKKQLISYHKEYQQNMLQGLAMSIQLPIIPKGPKVEYNYIKVVPIGLSGRSCCPRWDPCRPGILGWNEELRVGWFLQDKEKGEHVPRNGIDLQNTGCLGRFSIPTGSMAKLQTVGSCISIK